MKKKLTALFAMMTAICMLAGCGADQATDLKDMKTEKYVKLGEYKGLPVTITSAEETLMYTPSETGTCTVTVVITDAAGAIEIRTADFVIENEILYRALLIGNTYPYLADLDPESEDNKIHER